MRLRFGSQVEAVLRLIRPTDQAARDATLALLAKRTDGATVCPSEVARALAVAAGTTDWRAVMPTVHAAIDRLVADGRVQLS